MSVNLNLQLKKFSSKENYNAISQVSMLAEKFGVNIYLIGGIVRDLLLNIKIKDIDIAVEGDAVKFMEFLKNNINCEVIAVNEALKTSKIKFDNNVEIDFASTRTEVYNIQGNLPEAENFGCKLIEDVSRRDFTINTLAVKLTGIDKYSLIDYYNGENDIKLKLIKILHKNSFIDDPSRIVRALKFKIRFGFEYDTQTLLLMKNYLNNINHSIPLERIKNEIIDYFSENIPDLYNEFIKSNIYKLAVDYPVLSVNENILKDLSGFNLYSEKDKKFIFFTLLFVKTEHIFEKLNLSSKEKNIIYEVRELLNTLKEEAEYKLSIYKKFNNKNPISIAAYYLITQDKDVLYFYKNINKIKILINGNDLINLGLKPSKLYNEIFEAVLKEKLDKKLNNKEEELNFVKKYFIQK